VWHKKEDRRTRLTLRWTLGAGRLKALLMLLVLLLDPKISWRMARELDVPGEVASWAD